ncbi:hypothetical protein [Treponema sp.]|uniref:hypothetical protein n=1 Tax=Treponema sp. TaxID=166 RepID=UPI00388DA37A
MKEFTKKLTAFVLLFSYALMLVPAQEILREMQNHDDYVMHYELNDEAFGEHEVFMAEENGGVYTEDFSSDYDGTFYAGSGSALVFKSTVYGILQKAKEEFLKKYSQDLQTTEDVLLTGDDRIKKEWCEYAEKLVRQMIESEGADFDEDVFYEMEKEVYNLMLNELLYDHKSLRKGADKDSASIVVSELINELESSSESNIDKMLDELRIKIQNVNAGEVNVEAQNWLNDFNLKINAEIEKWDNAEKDFLARKFDFENTTYSDYLLQIEQWKKAYDEFDEKRKAWTESVNKKINEGLEIWEEKRNELETELNKKMEDYKNELYAEFTQKQEILQVNFEIYDQTRALLNAAESAVKSWCAKWAERYDGVYSYWKTESANDDEVNIVSNNTGVGYLTGTVPASWQPNAVVIPVTNPFHKLSRTTVTSENYKSILLEIEGVKKLYKETEYNKVNDSNKILWDELLELTNWIKYIGDYSSILSKTVKTISNMVDDNWNELDNSKNELEKNNALLLEQYLEEKLKIAKAVYNYSIDKTSGVESLEETKFNLEKSLELCKTAEENYEKTRLELEKSKQEYNTAKENYENQKDKVEKLLEKFSEVEWLYENTKPDESAQKGGEILQSVCSLVNSINTLKNEEKVGREKLKNYIEYLSQEEYDKVYENGLKVIRALEDCAEIETTDSDGRIVKQRIESIDELKTIIEYKKNCGLDYEEEQTMLDAKLSAIEYIKTGQISDRSNLNIDYEQIIETNKEFCVIERYKNDLVCMAEIKSVIGKYVGKKNASDLEDEKLSVFFDELDFTAESFGCSDYIYSALDLYKNQVLKEKSYKKSSGALTKEENARLEKVISGYLRENTKIAENKFWVKNFSDVFCSSNFFSVDIRKYDYEESDGQEPRVGDDGKESDDSAFLYSCLFSSEREYEKYYTLLRNTVLNYEKFNEEYSAYTQRVLDIQKSLDSLRAEYKAELDLLNSSKKESYFSILSSKVESYKEAAAFADERYNDLKNAKLEYEKCRKINEYAENQYLHTNLAEQSLESPYEIYTRCLAEYEEAKAAKEEVFLRSEKFSFDKETTALLDSYRKNVKDYASILTVESLAETKIINQIKTLYDAQQKVTEAMLDLVEEYESKAAADFGPDAGLEITSGSDFEVPEIVKKFVDFECIQDSGGNYSYSVSIKTGSAGESEHTEQREETLDEGASWDADTSENIYNYITQKNVSFYDIKNGKTEYSRSFVDCIDFLESLDKKPYGIDDLLLACCYLKMNDESSADDMGEKEKLFFEGEDPSKKENYPFSIPKDELYGLNFEKEYVKGRLTAVSSAYELIRKNGGLDDIAKFIFYAEFNLGSSYEFEQREIDVIATRGMDKVIKEISSKAAVYHNKGVAYAVSAASLFALGFVPFCKWAFAASAAAAVMSASNFSCEDSLNECKKDVIKIQSGYKEILDEYDAETDSMLSFYIKSKADADSATKVLNMCLYGKENNDGQEISYDDFMSAIKYMMPEYNFKISKKDFEEYSGGKNYSDVNEVISMIYSVMNSRKGAGLIQLEEKIKQNREEYENWDELKFQKELYRIYADTMVKNVPVSYENMTERYLAEGFEKLNECYEKILSENADNLLKEKMFECSLMMNDLENQIGDWEKQMNVVVESADYEWKKAEEKLLAEFNLWNRSFVRGYEECREKWNDEYESFLLDKNEWLETQYVKAALSGVESAEPDIDGRVRRIVENNLHSSDSFACRIDAEKYIDLIYDESLFKNLDMYSNDLNDIARNYSVKILGENKFEMNESLRDAVVNSTLEKIEKEMKNYAALYSMQIAREEIDNAVENIYSKVEESNRRMEKWELDLVRKDGYSVDSEIWRDAVVDSTVFENAVRKRQTVHRYEYFKCAYPVLSYFYDCSFAGSFAGIGSGGSLSGNYAGSFVGNSAGGLDSNFCGVDSDSMTLMMKKSFDEINDWHDLIFGDENQEGQFEIHVGKAPVFVSHVDTSKNYFENISENGSGQLGFIMLDFIWNSYINRDGYAALGTPLYDKKITQDNTFLGIELPTIRQITQTVCDIAAAATGNQLLGFIDETLYGALDLDFKTKDFDEVAKSFGKAAVTMGTGSLAGKAIESLDKCSDIALKVLGTSAVKTASSYSNSVLNSYIDAMSFENGFSIDFDRANRVWTDGGVLKSALSSGASYFTKATSSNILGKIDLYDGIGKRLESSVFDTYGLYALNDSISTVAAASVEKAITGRTSLSILDTSDLGISLKGSDVGLISLNFDKNGTSLRFDESGMKLNARKVLSAALSLRDFAKITGAKIRSGFNDDRGVSVLNVVNGLSKTGIEGNLETAKDVWEGRRKIEFFEGEQLGKYKDDVIYINKKFVANDEDSTAQMASLAAHENLHSYNADEFTARVNGYETYLALSDLYGIVDDKYVGESDIATYSEILRDYGEGTLFDLLFWSDAFNHTDDGFEYYMVNTKVANTYQNVGGMEAYILGDGWEKDKVDLWNKTKYQEEYNRYVRDEFKTYVAEKYREYVEHATGSVCKSIEEFKKEYDIDSFKQLNTLKYKNVESFKENISADRSLAKYKFDEETYDTIKSHGCVLTTAVYIVYSLDGTLVNLQDANEICKENKLFSGGEGRQKQLLSSGEGFMNAVNAIAKKELLIGYVSALNEKNGKGNPINKVYNECINSDKGYIGVARVLDNSHATMLKSEQNDYYYDEDDELKEMRLYNSFAVSNPWLSETGKWGRSCYSMKDVSNIYMYEVNPDYCKEGGQK